MEPDSDGKRIEEHLSLLAAIVEDSDDAIVTKDLDGAITSWNDGARRLYGYSAEEAIGQPVTLLLPPDRLDEEAQILDRVKRGEGVDHFETVRRCKDGRLIDVSVTISPIRDRAGRVVGASKIARDITSRKQTEAKLHDSELRYRRLFESARDGILILDAGTGQVEDVNPYLVELLDLSREEFLGKEVWELGFLGDVIASQEAFAELREKGYVRYEDLPLRSSGGQQVNVEFVSNVYHVDNQDVIQCNIRDMSEHKRAEDVLREAEARYRTIFEVAAEGIVVADIETRELTYANTAASEMFGYGNGEMVGMRVDGIHPADMLPGVLSGFEAQARGDVRVLPAVPCLRGDGSVFYADIATSPAEIDGRPGMVGFFSDVTERKQAGEALRQSEERFRVLFEQAADSIILLETKPDGMPVIRDANSATFRRLGYERDELIGKPVSFIEAEPAGASQTAERQRSTLPRTGAVFEVRHRCKDGTIRDVECSVTELQVGPETLTVSVERDITERKQAEEALQRSERLYRSLVEHLPQRVFLKDRNSVYLSCNANYAKDLGIAPEDIVGKDDFAFYPRELAEGYRADDQAVMEAATLKEVEEKYQIAGQARWIHTIKVPYHDAQGQVVGILGVFEDITEHRQLEEQLRQAQKMEAVGQLAGGVAHDFNNLLTGIGGFVGFARDAVEIGSQAYNDLGQVLTLTDRAADLTRQLLAFSRRQALASVVINVNDLISDYVKMLRRLLREDIDLQLVPAPELWNVRADPGQIEQVVTNMAVNARDAMPEGGKLIIETANVKLGKDYARDHADVVPGQYVVIAMSDTGCGMDAETQRKIFDPFFTTKEFGKGTGLGLATVYGIVKQHSGHVRVYSEPGKGTTFRVYLPRFAGEAEKPRTPSTLITGGTETILLVEDEEAIRAVSRRHLESFGYTVLCAADPDEAEDLAANHAKRIDLLLTDVIMPGRNGRELYESLAAKQPGLKVLYMSGYTDNVVVRNNVLGVETSLLQKPFGGHDLAGKVREALDG